ncbi:tetratricopeptide repeat protein [Hyalangium rubrum]|uniref:Tetratricopeptide repeat protein n=1 Tax=Hyalangium rubrum TaxID=3103134 RepID=A0ABU5HIS8_9BACT|nr:tetratricopeptide repeat protein [Hyalangium sp. s54d21]MDY7232784.1 hypothetical protein [Hyalangium sp. s54d21]
MRRLLVLCATLACVGGCSCEGKPAPIASVIDSGPAASKAQPAPPAAQEPPAEAPVPEQAMQLHSQGREHGEAGRYDEALQAFQQAQAAAPSWPMPLYDTGYTFVLMGETAKALLVYEQVDKLSPQGFSQSKKMLDSLRREQDGRVPKGTLREYFEVQRLRDLDEVRRRLEALTKKAPAFVLAWQDLAMSAEDPAEGAGLVDKTLALQPDVETRGELLVHKGVLLQRRGDGEAARKQFQAVIDDASLLPSTHALAREMLNAPGL